MAPGPLSACTPLMSWHTETFLLLPKDHRARLCQELHELTDVDTTHTRMATQVKLPLHVSVHTTVQSSRGLEKGRAVSLGSATS